jgi:hypothetical protein
VEKIKCTNVSKKEKLKVPSAKIQQAVNTASLPLSNKKANIFFFTYMLQN